MPHPNQEKQILMERLTAEKARELTGLTTTEKVDKILLHIEKVAREEKKRILRTGWEYKDDQELWVSGGYSTTPQWLEAKQMLEGLGFKVSFYYKESQFVDMYTLIEW